MEIPNIYVHDGTIFRVIEEPEHARITMEVELPNLDYEDERLEPRLLIFDDVYGYHVKEGCMNGYPTLLDFNVLGKEDHWARIRLDTTFGYREILCKSVKVLERDGQA
jgi:hypothetical protein